MDYKQEIKDNILVAESFLCVLDDFAFTLHFFNIHTGAEIAKVELSEKPVLLGVSRDEIIIKNYQLEFYNRTGSSLNSKLKFPGTRTRAIDFPTEANNFSICKICDYNKETLFGGNLNGDFWVWNYETGN